MDEYIYIDQGASFVKVFDTSLDLEGAIAEAQLSKWYGSSIFKIVTAAVEDNEGVFTVKLSLSPEETALLPAGRMVYDILVTDLAGTKTRFAQGQAVVTPGLSGVNVIEVPE